MEEGHHRGEGHRTALHIQVVGLHAVAEELHMERHMEEGALRTEEGATFSVVSRRCPKMIERSEIRQIPSSTNHGFEICAENLAHLTQWQRGCKPS